MDDPKLLSISDKDLRLWLRLLCYASKNDGNLPIITTLSKVLRVRLDHLQQGVNRLINVGLIDELAISLDQHYRPHNWSKRQYKSDTCNDRVAKHREKCNVTVTPRARQIQITDTDYNPLPPKKGGFEGGGKIENSTLENVEELEYEWTSAFDDYPHPAITNSENAYREFLKLTPDEKSMLAAGAAFAGASREFVSKRDRGYGTPFDTFIKSRAFVDAYHQFTKTGVQNVTC